MDKSEARLYFPESAEGTIEDQYDQHVFEWKQFFVNRFPISKLFKSKLEKIRRIEEAYSVLTGGQNTTDSTVFDTSFPRSLKDAYSHFEKERARYRQMLFQAQNLSEVITVVEAFSEYTRCYAQVWKNDFESLDGVIVSKEPDPMALLRALEEAYIKGVVEVSQLSKLSPDSLVVQESKRLSLWLKMEGDE